MNANVGLNVFLLGVGAELVGNVLAFRPPVISGAYGHEDPEALSIHNVGRVLAGCGQSLQYGSLLAPLVGYVISSRVDSGSSVLNAISLLGGSILGVSAVGVCLLPIVTAAIKANADTCLNFNRTMNKRWENLLGERDDFRETDPLLTDEILSGAGIVALSSIAKIIQISILVINQPVSTAVGAGALMGITWWTALNQ